MAGDDKASATHTRPGSDASAATPLQPTHKSVSKMCGFDQINPNDRLITLCGTKLKDIAY